MLEAAQSNILKENNTQHQTFYYRTFECKYLLLTILHHLYPFPDIVRQIESGGRRWAGHVTRIGEERKVCKVLVGKPEGERPLRRPRR
jgi:hypothetical protein